MHTIHQLTLKDSELLIVNLVVISMPAIVWVACLTVGLLAVVDCASILVVRTVAVRFVMSPFTFLFHPSYSPVEILYLRIHRYMYHIAHHCILSIACITFISPSILALSSPDTEHTFRAWCVWNGPTVVVGISWNRFPISKMIISAPGCFYALWSLFTYLWWELFPFSAANLLRNRTGCNELFGHNYGDEYSVEVENCMMPSMLPYHAVISIVWDGGSFGANTGIARLHIGTL